MDWITKINEKVPDTIDREERDLQRDSLRSTGPRFLNARSFKDTTDSEI